MAHALATQSYEVRGDSSPMIRYRRTAVFTVCLTCCVLLIALWVRSHSWRDELFGIPFGSGTLAIVSQRGTIEFVTMPASGNDIFGDTSFPVDEPMPFIPNLPSTLGRTGVISPGPSVPHKLLVLVTAILAVVPWIERRFSLRTLLIAMTLIAVLLGILAISN